MGTMLCRNCSWANRYFPRSFFTLVFAIIFALQVVTKILDELVAESLLSEKLYGKQKIYWLNPSESVPAKEILLELDAKIRDELAKISQIQKELKSVRFVK